MTPVGSLLSPMVISDVTSIPVNRWTLYNNGLSKTWDQGCWQCTIQGDEEFPLWWWRSMRMLLASRCYLSFKAHCNTVVLVCKKDGGQNQERLQSASLNTGSHRKPSWSRMFLLSGSESGFLANCLWMKHQSNDTKKDFHCGKQDIFSAKVCLRAVQCPCHFSKG